MTMGLSMKALLYKTIGMAKAGLSLMELCSIKASGVWIKLQARAIYGP